MTTASLSPVASQTNHLSVTPYIQYDQMKTAQITVLVVDDSVSIRALLRQILEQSGYHVYEAGDGLEALECFQCQHIDIVLTDLEMPGMDGLSLIAALNERYISLPIIVVSVYSSLASAMEAIHKGAWDYLQKPIHEEEVRIAMNRVLDRMWQFKENRRIQEQMASQLQLQTLEIRTSKERYQRLLKSVTSYVYTVTVDHGIAVHTTHGSGCEKVTGYTPEEYDANQDLWYRLVHDDDRELVIDMARRILVEMTKREVEHRINHKGGSIRWIRNTLVPSLDLDGKLLCYDGIITDITGQKEADEALKKSELKFKTLFEFSMDGFLVADIATRRFIHCNSTICRMLGYDEDELLGLGVDDIHPAADIKYVMEQFEKQIRGETACSGNLPVLRKDGTIFYSDINAGVFELGEVTCLLGSFRDVTERRQSEEQQKRHTENLTSLRTIDVAITGSLDLGITLKVLLNETINRLKVDAACVLLMDPHTRTLEYMAGTGFGKETAVGLRCKSEEIFAGHVSIERSSIVINDASSCSSPAEHTLHLVNNGFKAYVGVPLIAKGQVKGVLEIFCRLPLTADPEWLEFVEALGAQAAIAIDNAEMFDDLQQSHSELLLAYDTTIEGWSRAMDFRDKETEGHSRRVTDLTVRLAYELGFAKERLVQVRRGALLHDIGKLGVPDCILLKPGSLTPEEFEIMKRHTEIAFSILSPIEFLRPALDIPCSHHEKWDGSGYPRGLKGEEIPLAARIFAIVDVWDALRSDRPYRPAWPPEKALGHICSQSGSHFDPTIVSLFKEFISAR